VSTSDAMRQLAAELRQQAETQKIAKREKAAQVIKAATGLGMLRQKLGGTHA